MKAVLLVLAVACGAGEAQLPGTRLLADGQLRLEVMDPAAPDRYNRGVRFAPLAAVLRANLAGREFLYAPLKHDPLADHGGLANEFDLCIPGGPREHLPPGWREAGEGGGFLKIGVGILQKKGADYHLFHQPAVLATAATEVRWEASNAVFTQTCPLSDGLAYRLQADLSVRDPVITVAWRLENTGTRAFTTRTYCHNFLRFDDRDAGPGYELSFPYPITVAGALAEQRVLERAIRFDARIPTWVNLEIAWPAGYDGANTCTLSHPEVGMALHSTTSLPGERTAVHARAGYIAPEQFIRLDLAPGAQVSWTRSWRFELTAP